MQTQINTMNVVKMTAKTLQKCTLDMKLSDTQEALAKALGYRGWYELSRNSVSTAKILESTSGSQDWKSEVSRVIFDLSSKLGISSGQTQYLLSKSSLFHKGWTEEDHIQIRLLIWEKNGWVNSKTLRPGSLIKVVDEFSERHAYLCGFSRITHVLHTTGKGGCADFEVKKPDRNAENFIPLRLFVPYGYWETSNGKVVFSRDYCPMWLIEPEGRIQRLAPWKRIRNITSNHFFSDGPDWFKEQAVGRARKFLEDHNIQGLPMLVDGFPFVLNSLDRTIKSAIESMERFMNADDLFATKYLDDLVEGMKSSGDELAIVDSFLWEKFQIESGLKPEPNAITGDPTIIYKGVELIQSAVN